MRAAFQAVAFDLDGTLIDSVPDVGGALNRMLASRGRPELSLRQVLGLVGQGARIMVARAMELTGPVVAEGDLDSLVATYVGFYRAHPVVRTTIYPGVVEVLDGLAGAGVRLGICSNKPLEMTKLVLETLGLAKYFSGVTGGDNVTFRKPDGRHVRQTLELMGATGLDAAMVGDSETDVAAGKDAGLPVVAVTYGYAHVPVTTLGADAVIEHFSALPEALRCLARRRAPGSGV